MTFKDLKINLKKKSQTFLLNFGPQHPAAHGIIKIGLQLSGEIILRADPQYGLLHRGSEKLIENKTIMQSIPYLDRMDYVANLFQEHAIVSSFEGLTNTKINVNVFLSRVVFDEFSRILNHLLTVGAICLDMGSMGPIFWAFEEREQIMELFEKISGARMHTALYRPFGFNNCWFSKNIYIDILNILKKGSRFITGSFVALLNNRAFKTRLSGVGKFSFKKIKNYGITGVMARASGFLIDLRLSGTTAYSNYYSLLNFNSFIGVNGDCFDRFILRSKEIVESFKIITQCLNIRPFKNNSLKKKFLIMEDVINHFKKNSNFELNNKGINMSIVEGPKGFVGVFVVNNNKTMPYRLHVRSPVFNNMSLILSSGNNITFADFVATFCSMDVVLGEIDR